MIMGYFLLSAEGGGIHFDATLVAAVAFGIFIGAIFALKVPNAIGKGLDDQAAAIRAELDKAKQLREEAEALRKSYETQQAQAEADAKAMIAQAETDAKEMKKQAKAQLEADIASKTKAAQDRIKRAELAAIEEVRDFAANKAIDAAGLILAKTASSKNGDKIFKQSLSKVSAALSKVN